MNLPEVTAALTALAAVIGALTALVAALYSFWEYRAGINRDVHLKDVKKDVAAIERATNGLSGEMLKAALAARFAEGLAAGRKDPPPPPPPYPGGSQGVPFSG